MIIGIFAGLLIIAVGATLGATLEHFEKSSLPKVNQQKAHEVFEEKLRLKGKEHLIPVYREIIQTTVYREIIQKTKTN